MLMFQNSISMTGEFGILHIKAYCMKKGVNDKVRYFYDYQRASKLLKFVLELLSWGKQRHRDLLARQFSTPF